MAEEFPCAATDPIQLVISIPANFTNFSAALTRFMAMMHVRTQQELADALGIRQSWVSDAKRRQQIPAWWLVRLQLEKDISPLWVLTGQPSAGTPGNRAPEELARLMELVG